MRGASKLNLNQFAFLFCPLACVLLSSCSTKLEIETDYIEPLLWKIDCRIKLKEQENLNLNRAQIFEICDLLRLGTE